MNKMESAITSHTRKGLIIVAVLIILDLLLKKSGMPVSDGLQYLPRLVFSFIGVAVSCLVFAKQSAGKLKFAEVFAHGFKTTAAIAFMMALYTFIAVKFIYAPPSVAEMETAGKAIQQQGNVMPEEAKQMAMQAAKSRWIIYVSLSIFASLIPGILGAVMGAALAKKNQ
jgi:Protein of unknown function (DUF4199)